MATATNFLLLKPNLRKWNNQYPARYHPVNVIQHYSSIKIKNSSSFFTPLKINSSNFKALTVETGFSPCKLKENPFEFEILAKRFVNSSEAMKAPVALALFLAGFFLPVCESVYGISLGRPLFVVGVIAIMCCLIAIADDSTSTNSVYKLQVGLLGLESCSLEKDLDCIAETADTSTSEGLQYVLTEATLALIRHSYSGIHYDTSSFSVKESTDKVEKRFKQLSIEERGKFDNINKKKNRSTKLRTSTTGISNEYIEVTILVAAKGVHSDLPFIEKGKDLRDALLDLATIPYSSTLLAVEVLWTTQYEDDTPPEEEFLED